MANETEADLSAYSHSTMYRILGRNRYEVNTDPLRRCYDGVHAKSEMVWGAWQGLGAVHTQQEAEQSVKDWHKYQRSWGAAHAKNRDFAYLQPGGTTVCQPAS